jgi:hypothetical protein
MEVDMANSSRTDTAAKSENGESRLTPQDVERLFGDGYREIEILPDGTLRETTRTGDAVTEAVTRSLKTERTWY